MLRLVILLWALASGAWPAFAQDVLPVPALTARVIDQTGTLDDIQRAGLEQKLAALETSKGTQLVILMVPTTAPEDIGSYANRVANTWKIGRKQVGDGVLLIVAKNDRKVRIEVAKTLEGAIPDLAARQVIDDAITPKFRAGDFAGGLQAAADQLIARINGEALPAPPPQRTWHEGDARGAAGFDWFDLAIFLFFAVPVGGAVLRRIFGRPLGTLLTGGGVGVLAFVFTTSIVIAVIAGLVALVFSLLSGFGGPRRGGWGGGPFIGGLGGGGFGGGGFGGGGGGGGFSSGGGGDFGGGGASGDW